MSKLPIRLIILIVLLLIPFFLPPPSSAARFQQALVRLDRTKASTATGGTICAKTSSGSAGTEAKVSITFPDSFTINSNQTNWTVSTSNLPLSASAWPGIDTATGVSGKTVTFPSNNITDSTALYCFNFSGTSTLTNPTAGHDLAGTLTTKASNNATIDSSDLAFSIISTDQITYTASVPASPSDFQSSMALTSPSGSAFAQDTTLTYTYTYGSYLTTQTSIVMEASWSLGTVSGSGTPTVDLLDYVVGSATDAYNSTPPVIDTTNRKITWTISPFPANTQGKTVTFKLKTNSSYTGSSTVSFDVSGRVVGPGNISSATSTVTKNYQYDSGTSPTSTPTPTNTPTPGPTSTPGPTATPTPVSTEVSFAFDTVAIQTISSKQASVAITLTKDAVVTLAYGTTLTGLNDTVTSLSPSTSHLVALENLAPNTKYFFRVIVRDAAGKTIRSDLFTFQTANETPLPPLDLDSLIVTSDNTLIAAPRLFKSGDETTKRTIIIPSNFVFDFRIGFEKQVRIKRIQAIIRNSKILGLSTIVQKAEASYESTDLVEISPGSFAGRLHSPIDPGSYFLFLRIEDYNGNIGEVKVGNIQTLKRLRILEKGTNTPIENARVYLSYQKQSSRTYEPISSGNQPIKNPSFSETNGDVLILLPAGGYRAEITAIGYKKHTVNFTIGIHPSETFPIVYLEKKPFNAVSSMQYYAVIATDILQATKAYVRVLTASHRFFDLTSLIVLASLVFLTLLSFSHRIHIPLHSLLSHFKHVRDRKKNENSVNGKILDADSEKPLSSVDVYLIDAKSGKSLVHTKTNRNGIFDIRNLSNTSYQITALLPNYLPLRMHVDLGEKNDTLILSLTQQRSARLSLTNLAWYYKTISSFSFELLLIVSVVAEALLGYSLGWAQVLPFFLLSCGNLLLWLHHLKHAMQD